MRSNLLSGGGSISAGDSRQGTGISHDSVYLSRYDKVSVTDRERVQSVGFQSHGVGRTTFMGLRLLIMER
jgi:hypothetical protein